MIMPSPLLFFIMMMIAVVVVSIVNTSRSFFSGTIFSVGKVAASATARLSSFSALLVVCFGVVDFFKRHVFGSQPNKSLVKRMDDRGYPLRFFIYRTGYI